MVSGALGRPVTLLDQPEMGVALGAALLSGAEEPAPAEEPFPNGPLPRATFVGRAPVPGREPDAERPPSPRRAPTPPQHPAWSVEPTAPYPQQPPPEPPSSTAMVAIPIPIPIPAPAGAGRRSYRWPVIGGIAAVLVTVTVVTAATAWPWDRDRTGGSPAAVGNQPSASASVAASGSAAGTEAGVLWKVATGAAATGPPAVSAQRIIVGGQDGTLRAFRRGDGTLDWQVALGAGLRVSTRIVGNVVVATTGDGDVAGVDANAGGVLWRRNLGAPIGARAATSAQFTYVAGRDGAVEAYRIGEGSRRWRLRTKGEITRPPLVTAGTVVVAAGDGKLYGVTSTGVTRWTATVGKVIDGPLAAGDAACATIDNGTVKCVRASDGAKLSSITQPVPIARIAGGRLLLYTAGADGSITGWNPDTAKVLWRYPRSGKAGFPALGTSEVDVAYPDGTLAGLDARSGEELWRNATGDHFGVGPSSDATGVFAVGTKGTLYALRPPD